MTEQATTTTAPAAAARPELTLGHIARYVGRALLIVIAVFCVVWVLFLADNSALERPELFITTTLNAITLGGALLRGRERLHARSSASCAWSTWRTARSSCSPATSRREWDQDHDQWLVGLVVACVFVAILGVVMQQTLLRWNQGQDLRQALITIAVSVILADQMLASSAASPPT